MPDNLISEKVIVQEKRLKPLNAKAAQEGDYVVFWIQASQRAQYNHVLEYSITQLFRPLGNWRPYATPLKGVYLCSSSLPPGAGFHGMCGYHAAKCVLKGN